MRLDPEVIELEEVITVLDTLFEAGEDTIHPITNKLVSDAEYDRLRKRLEELHPTSHVLQSITASRLASTAKKVRHDPPMTSISKAIGTLEERSEALEKFRTRVVDELGYRTPMSDWAVQAYKRDGVALALYYEKGKLVRAGLRPRKSDEGEDVTANVVHVEGVPTELWEHDRQGNRTRFLPVTCCVRGEVECRKSDFEKIKKDWKNPVYDLGQEPKNPRNYSAGSIRQFNNPAITKERKLNFTAYSILAWSSQDPQLNSPPFKTEVARAKYANTILRIPFVQVRPFRGQDLEMLEKLAPSLDYGVDGVIISVNNLEDAEQMGTHGNKATGNPKGKIAWKFAEERVIVKVKNYVFAAGRTGKLTPVILFDGVQLAGTTVSQCTGHSLGFMNGTSKSSVGQIGVDAEIEIIKAGEIIPKVIRVVTPGKPFEPLAACPSCGTKLEVRTGEDSSDLFCPNAFCGEQAVARFVHYLSTFGVKGVADSTIEKCLIKGHLKTHADLYDLTVEKLEDSGLSRRQSLQALARIWMCENVPKFTDEQLEAFLAKATKKKITVPAWQFIASLGIPGAGKSSGQALVSHFGNLDAVLKANREDLVGVADVGGVTADAIYKFFNDYKGVIEKLLTRIEPEGQKQGKLSGKTFVFTGGFPGSKSKWEKMVIELGGTVSGQVSKNTTYLVVGTDSGSKEGKADSLGVAKIKLEELEKML